MIGNERSRRERKVGTHKQFKQRIHHGAVVLFLIAFEGIGVLFSFAFSLFVIFVVFTAVSSITVFRSGVSRCFDSSCRCRRFLRSTFEGAFACRALVLHRREPRGQGRSGVQAVRYKGRV